MGNVLLRKEMIFNMTNEKNKKMGEFIASSKIYSLKLKKVRHFEKFLAIKSRKKLLVLIDHQQNFFFMMKKSLNIVLRVDMGMSFFMINNFIKLQPKLLLILSFLYDTTTDHAI